MVREIKRTDIVGDYIKATHIGTIVKHYTGENFSTFDNIDIVVSRLKWTKEEREKYEIACDEFDPFRKKRFADGKEFEIACEDLIFEQYPLSDKIYNWNDRDTCLYDDELKLLAVPDYILEDSALGNKIFECKGSKSTTKNYDNYVYQLALQYYLLKQLNQKEYDAYLMFSDKSVQIKNIEKFADVIVECIKKFWIDYDNGCFTQLSVDEAIKLLKQDNWFVEDDESIIEKINIIKSYEDKKDYIDSLKKEIFNYYQEIGYSKIKTGDVKLSIIKPNIQLINKDYYVKQIASTKKSYYTKVDKITKEMESHTEDYENVVKSGFIKFS